MNRWKFLAVMGALAVALAALLATPAAAAGYPIAYNAKTQYLTASPNDSMPLSCVERRIYLAEGRYDWIEFVELYGRSEQAIRYNLYLGAGWYTWKDCLDPATGNYYQTNYLDPDNPNWVTVYGSQTWWSGTGDVTWGSYLRPLF